MKTSSKLYLFFTSLLFLFSPLSLGLAAIYFEMDNDNIHLPGLLVNAILILVLAVIIVSLISKSKLQLPNRQEQKFLLFGLLSNIVIYFYVFQNSLNIEKEMTIYLIVIMILLLYFLIINRKTILKELWILAIWFFVIDTVHYHGLYRSWGSDSVDATFFIRLFYISIPLLTLGLYVYEMKKYKLIDIFTGISITIVAFTSLLFFDVFPIDSKFMLTLNLILPFVILSDFITMLIYKRFNALKISFYLRLYTLMILIIFYAERNYFTFESYSNERLYEMVGIIYVALICNLIAFLIPRQIHLNEELDEENVYEEELTLETKETLLSIDLELLTITTLKAIAKAKGIEDYTKLEKEEIINLLK